MEFILIKRRNHNHVISVMFGVLCATKPDAIYKNIFLWSMQLCIS